MKSDGSPRPTFQELIKYFGFSIVSVIVLSVAFLFISRSIYKEIQKATYQVLEDSVRQQSVTFQKYFSLLKAHTKLIAEYDAETGPKALVESLRTELKDSVLSMEIGFANPDGLLLYSDQKVSNVAKESWFQDSLAGTTCISMMSQNRNDGQEDIVVSSPVHTVSGVSGVLFVTVDGIEIAGLINTLAYDGKAMSVVCDAKGNVLFSEPRLGTMYSGGNIFDYAKHISIQEDVDALGLAAALKKGITAGISYQYNGVKHYAVAAPVGFLDWRVITFISSETSDNIQRHVSMYLLGMLFLVLMIGGSVSIQAFLHERMAVGKLEKDKELLRQSAQRYLLITRLSNEVLFTADLETGVISFNDSYEAMFGCAPPNCSIDHLDQCAQMFIDEDQQPFLSMMNRLRAGDSAAREELRMVNARGVVRWKRIEIYTVFDQNEQAVQLIGKIADIHRQKQSLQRLARQADSEPLTGLLNRAAMERNITGFLLGEGQNRKHALLMMDFDNFKAVNDTLGHAKGDDLLISFAAGIKRLFRSGDYASRIGGDEYMIFIKDTYEDGIALEKAEVLRTEMASLSRKIGVPVSISVGIAIYNRDGKSFEQLYKAADEALYQVKNNGKNSVSLYSVSVPPPMVFDRDTVDSEEEDGDELE